MRFTTTLGLIAAHLEHCQHAMGNGISASGIAGAEQHRDESDRLLSHRARVEQGKQRTDHDDAMHEIGPGHQRGVQDRRYATNDHPPRKGGEHEDIEGHDTVHFYLKIHRYLRFGLMQRSQPVWSLHVWSTHYYERLAWRDRC